MGRDGIRRGGHAERLNGGFHCDRYAEAGADGFDQAVERLNRRGDLRGLAAAMLGGRPKLAPDLIAGWHVDQGLAYEVFDSHCRARGERVIGCQGHTPWLAEQEPAFDPVVFELAVQDRDVGGGSLAQARQRIEEACEVNPQLDVRIRSGVPLERGCHQPSR